MERNRGMKRYDVVSLFEQKVADFAGSKYAVSCDSCTNAIFLCLQYLKPEVASIPNNAYIGVANSIIHCGADLYLHEEDWLQRGYYEIVTDQMCRVIDSAIYFQPNMYIPHTMYCLSFQARKPLPIGRGGMVLTDSEEAAQWLSKARINGRTDEGGKYCEFPGWNMYMMPEQAAKGVELLETRNLPPYAAEHNDYQYPDLNTIDFINRIVNKH